MEAEEQPAEDTAPRSLLASRRDLAEIIPPATRRFSAPPWRDNMQQAARVSDYTAFFFQGRIVEFGPTTQIFSNPREKQTEEYITGRFG